MILRGAEMFRHKEARQLFPVDFAKSIEQTSTENAEKKVNVATIIIMTAI